MGFETASIQSDSLKAKATILTAKGMIGISVQIYFILSSGRNVSLLEVIIYNSFLLNSCLLLLLLLF